MPCYDCGDGQRLWGLTLLMLDELRRMAAVAGDDGRQAALLRHIGKP